MQKLSISRREFIATSLAGAAVAVAPSWAAEGAGAVPGRSLPGGSPTTAFTPFPSLEAALNGTCSQFFGVKQNDGAGATATAMELRVAKDLKSLYRPGGVSGAEEPHSFGLSFEITNHRILCSATGTGLLQNPCIFSRLVPAWRRGSTLNAAELLGGSAWSFGLRRKGDSPIRLAATHRATLDLLDVVFPIFGYQHRDLRVRLLVFAPLSGPPSSSHPRALITVVQVRNAGNAAWEGSLLAPNLRDLSEVNAANSVASPAESPHPRFTEHPVPIQPGYEAVLCLDNTTWSPAPPEIAFALQSGEGQLFTFGLLLGENPEELRRTGQALRRLSVLEWLNQTARLHAERNGRLAIPADPYYAEKCIRQIEAATSAILYSEDGRQFSGGPSGYADFALALFEPETMVAGLKSLADFRPRHAGAPAWEGLNDSLVNSTGVLAQSGLYYRMTGDRVVFRETPGILAYAREVLADLPATRRGQPWLFPSKRIWDGPARGDYHTGSNIVVWLAYQGMARVAREAYDEPRLAASWSEIAGKIKQDIFRHCIGGSRLGRRFFEGANADGSFVPGHDGEEAFTTLAPYFDFCETDEPALLNHARLAFTTENPLYEPAVDGIWWEARGLSWSGITMPGQMAMLAACGDEKELASRLEQLRGLTDLDGSLWWWPYLAPCNDRQRVCRREAPSDCSKSGYASALYLCLFVHNILGLSVDVPARRVSLRPFCPWPAFTWEHCRLGRSEFDFAYTLENGRLFGSITNRNREPFDGQVELLLPAANRVIGDLPTGAVSTRRYNRSAIKSQAMIKPGQTLKLELTYTT